MSKQIKKGLNNKSKWLFKIFKRNLEKKKNPTKYKYQNIQIC